MHKIDSYQDLQDMARGAVFLGTGGGGDPYIGELFVREQIKQGNFPVVISPEEVPDDAFVLCIAGTGAPTVIVEHLISEDTLLRLLSRAEAYFGRKPDIIISAEMGGANSIFPLALSAITGIPVVDADGIGRAVPQMEMSAFSIYGASATPCVMVDDAGNTVIVEAVSDRVAENITRHATLAMGSIAFCAAYPMSGAQFQKCAVKGTLALTLGIGRTIREAREGTGDVFQSLLDFLGADQGRTARILFDGKIADVTHETRDGWHWGLATLQNLRDEADRFTLQIRNEFLIAHHNGRPVTMVPDLIAVLDRESAEPLTAEMLTYGQRVKVIGYSADPMLRTKEGLVVMGPRMFGLDEDYVSIEDLMADR
jgi:DUF917 family protein